MTDHKWNLKFSDIDSIEQDINDLSERFLKIEKFVEARGGSGNLNNTYK